VKKQREAHITIRGTSLNHITNDTYPQGLIDFTSIIAAQQDAPPIDRLMSIACFRSHFDYSKCGWTLPCFDFLPQHSHVSKYRPRLHMCKNTQGNSLHNLFCSEIISNHA
jgi:hypothetical protein